MKSWIKSGRHKNDYNYDCVRERRKEKRGVNKNDFFLKNRLLSRRIHNIIITPNTVNPLLLVIRSTWQIHHYCIMIYLCILIILNKPFDKIAAVHHMPIACTLCPLCCTTPPHRYVTNNRNTFSLRLSIDPQTFFDKEEKKKTCSSHRTDSFSL